MQVGRVAKEIGLSVDAIRFYERTGLLRQAPRTEGGFRQYGENDLETLAFVRRAQGLGFKLSEIRGLLRLRGNRLQPCAPVKCRLEEKLADVERKPAAGSVVVADVTGLPAGVFRSRAAPHQVCGS
ncbi:MAG TPA: MerR family transcriptional regulator [Candidatus Acidoferrum sp.]